MENIIYEDTKSTLSLLKNGHLSSSKCTKHSKPSTSFSNTITLHESERLDFYIALPNKCGQIFLLLLLNLFKVPNSGKCVLFL
jgi:hypothetical protein